MNKNDAQAFSESICGAYLMTGEERPSAELLRALWVSLADHPIGDIKNAIQAHLRDPERGRRAPKLADIMDKLIDHGAPLKAWTRAIDAAESVGAYQSVAFDDPFLMVAIQGFGGWIAFCQMPADEQRFKIHEFTKRYQAAQKSDERPTLPHLLGIIEGERLGNGLKPPAPVLIGDKEKILRLQQEVVSGSGSKQIGQLIGEAFKS